MSALPLWQLATADLVVLPGLRRTLQTIGHGLTRLIFSHDVSVHCAYTLAAYKETFMRRISLIFLLLLTAMPADAANHQPRLPQPAPPSLQQDTTVVLGQDSYRGVSAAAKLRKLPATDGRSETYLLTVRFDETKSGRQIQQGDVAAKIIAPNGSVGVPVRLLPEGGVFQTIIVLAREGESMIRIGSKLNDGKKRIYRFFFQAAPAMAGN